MRRRHSLTESAVRSLVQVASVYATALERTSLRPVQGSAGAASISVQSVATSSDRLRVRTLDPAPSMLARLIGELEQRLPSYFEQGAFTTRERLHDPDSTASPLFVIVHTKLAPAEALASLERFDQEWWLDQAPLIAGLLEVSIAYEM